MAFEFPPLAPRLRVKRISLSPFPLLLLFLLPSCNLARQHNRACDKRLQHNDYLADTILSNGQHFVWHRSTGKPMLLLLHGYTGTGALQWSKTAALLDDDYDCDASLDCVYND